MSVPRRVLVTGIGLVTPLGKSRQSSWSALVNKQSGVVPWPEEKTSVARCSAVTAEDLKRITSTNPRAQESRFISLALLAGEEALKDANLTSEDLDKIERYVAVVIGCGMGAATGEIPTISSHLPASPRKVSPFFIPRLLPNMAAGNLSILYDLRGPNLAPATACASGAHAIIDAARLIQRGDCEVALCGGTESSLDTVSAVGFGRLKALSGQMSSSASRPFDGDRDGFVMGEGAGVLVLESEDHFRKRNQQKSPYAVYLGGGMSGDAHHITSPHSSGRGAVTAMNMALKDARQAQNDITIDYVNAHATSTPMGDVIEAEAISRVMITQPMNKNKVMVSSTKGATGHLLGAAGAVEAAFTILSIHHGIVPPTLHLDNLDPQLPVDTVDFICKDVRKADVRYAMSNSFGFGGTNASLIFGKYAA